MDLENPAPPRLRLSLAACLCGLLCLLLFACSSDSGSSTTPNDSDSVVEDGSVQDLADEIGSDQNDLDQNEPDQDELDQDDESDDTAVDLDSDGDDVETDSETDGEPTDVEADEDESLDTDLGADIGDEDLVPDGDATDTEGETDSDTADEDTSDAGPGDADFDTEISPDPDTADAADLDDTDGGDPAPVFPVVPTPSTCGSEASPDSITLCGTVSLARAGISSGFVPAPSVAVSASLDRSGDGVLDDTIEVTTNGAGEYALTVPLDRPHAIQLRVTPTAADLEGAPHVQTLQAIPGVVTQLDINTPDVVTFQCPTDEPCVDLTNGTTLSALPTNVAVVAGLVIDPEASPEALPAGLDGRVLEPVVGSLLVAVDESGDSVAAFSSESELCVSVPQSGRGRVTDSEGGNGQIDIDIWSWDETRGTWAPGDGGVLKDGELSALEEERLEDVRNGTFTAELFACIPVTSGGRRLFGSEISVDRCVTGAAAESGRTLASALVDVSTDSAGTRTLGSITDGGGRFRLDVPGTEGPLSLNITSGSDRFAHAFDGAGCAAPDCCDVTAPFIKETGAVCEISGTVRDETGASINIVAIEARDRRMSLADFERICGDTPANVCVTATPQCQVCDVVGVDGSYTLRVPLLESATVAARHPLDDGMEYASRDFTGCPTAPFDVTVQEPVGMWVRINLTVTPGEVPQLSWPSPRPMDEVIIFATDGSVLWWVEAVDPVGAGIESPVVYGVVPTGAVQHFPVETPPEVAPSEFEVLMTVDHYEDGLRTIACVDNPNFSRCMLGLRGDVE